MSVLICAVAAHDPWRLCRARDAEARTAAAAGVDRDLDDGVTRFARRRIQIGPAAFAVAIATSFFGTAPSLLVFACAPLLYLFPGRSIDTGVTLREESANARRETEGCVPQRAHQPVR
jgi:hypothetical protein